MHCSIFSKLPSIFGEEKCLLGKIAVVTVAGVCVHFAVKTYKKLERDRRRKGYKQDLVILHQFDPATTIPSMSPFALKLETYLRIAKIPYENDFIEPLGPKNKCPWITYNGVDVADSAFCIKFLNEKFSINLDERLEPAEKAVGRCLATTAETNFVLCLAMWRYCYDPDLSIFKLMPTMPFLFKLMPAFLIRRKIVKLGRIIGIGRHSEKEVYDIGVGDLKAFSTYLGKDRYFLGEEVSEIDCAMFGMLAQCVWASPNSPFEAILNDELRNLKEYCERMKAEFWPDWDKVLYKN